MYLSIDKAMQLSFLDMSVIGCKIAQFANRKIQSCSVRSLLLLSLQQLQEQGSKELELS